MGCLAKDTQCNDDEKPARRASVDAFALGKFLVTVAQYAKCADAGACSREPEKLDAGNQLGTWKNQKLNHPVNALTWDEARTFCERIGGRLPSAQEWEYAAKSGEDNVYPWGDAPVTGQRANYCDANCDQVGFDTSSFTIDRTQNDGYAGTSPVGTYPAGATKWGLFDMAGNVWEWTESKYDANTREARGGGWNGPARVLRPSFRFRNVPSLRFTDFGVRCALSR